MTGLDAVDGSFLAVRSVTALWHLDAGGGSRPQHQERSFDGIYTADPGPLAAGNTGPIQVIEFLARQTKLTTTAPGK